MTDKEQTDNFAQDVDRLVERYRAEYEMTYATVVGVLQMKIHQLCQEAMEIGNESD